MRPTPTLLATVLAALASPAFAGPVDDARAAENSGDTAAAVTGWRAAIAAEPQVAEHYEALGRLLTKAKDYPAAIEVYRRLVGAVPAHVAGRYRLAFVLRKAGRLAEAAEAYAGYIAVAPDDPDGHFGLARTLEKLGRGPEAVGAYRRYVELERRPSEARWVETARARITALSAVASPGSPPPAAAPHPPGADRAPEFPPAAAAEPRTSPPAQPVRGELLADSPVTQATPAADPDAAFAEARYAEAAAGYLARLESAEDPRLRYRAAVSATLAGDAVLAGEQVRIALRAMPGHEPGLRLGRANAADIDRVRGDSPAIADIERALREGRLRTAARLAGEAAAVASDPTAARRLDWIRGRALARLGRHDEALAALKHAAAVFGGHPELWAELSEVAARRGDLAAARSFRALAAAVAPPSHPLATSHPENREAR